MFPDNWKFEYNWRRKLFHFINGVWTGIPLCCINYWNQGYSGIHRDKPDPNWPEAHYVRCNECAAARRSKKTRSNGVIARWLLKGA